MKQLGAELFNADGCHRVSRAPVQQVDGSVMPYFTFGDESCACHGFLKAANHVVDQLIRVVGMPSLRIAFNPLVELIPQALMQLRQQFQLIAALPAFQGALASLGAQLLGHFFANHDRPAVHRRVLLIKVAEVAVVSHQGWPLHRNALRPVERCRLGLFQRDGHGAGLGRRVPLRNRL